MSRKPSRWVIALVALSILGLAAFASACGEEADSDVSGSADIQVAATTGVASDIVSQVAGDDVAVTALVPDGANPHSYAPSAREQQDIAESDLLVYFHPALEESLPIDAAPNAFAIADHVGGVRTFAEGEADDHGDAHGGSEDDEEHAGKEHADDEEHAGKEHSDDEHAGEEHEHGPGSSDPHVWLDPTAVAAALPALADALGEADPDRAGDYRQRAEDYAAELEALDSELAAMTGSVPRENRKLVTSHDLMGYFADRYDFEVIGAPFGLSPEAEASASGVAELIDLVVGAGVPAVFAQQGDDPEVLRLIADEAGVRVVDDLLVESLGERAESYEEMMRYTTGRITDALGG